MKGKLIILLLVTLLLLVGVANAADINTDGINSDISDSISTDAQVVNEVAVQERQSVSMEDTNRVEKINKKEENLKTASQTHDVANYDQLSYAMNSNDEEVTININSNITLAASPELNTNIKTLTINGNSYTINGDKQYRFLNIQSNQIVNINNITITNCHAQDRGGAIYNTYEGTLTITQSNLTQNTATGQY